MFFWKCIFGQVEDSLDTIQWKKFCKVPNKRQNFCLNCSMFKDDLKKNEKKTFSSKVHNGHVETRFQNPP